MMKHNPYPAIDLLLTGWAKFLRQTGRHPERIYASSKILDQYSHEILSMERDPWSSLKIDKDGHLLFRAKPIILCASGHLGFAG